MELQGRRFGRLTVVGFDKINEKTRHAKWFCVCDCGAVKSVFQHNLLSGNTKSCGCLQREISRRIGKQNGKRNHEGDQQ